MTSWQPIATAPKDGTDILLAEWRPHFKSVGDRYGEIDIGCWHTDDGWISNYGRVEEPTMWMPLPKPPT